MPKLACAAWGFRNYSPREYFAAVKNLGLDFVEINLDEGQTEHLSPSDSDAELMAAKQQAEEQGVRIVAVAGSSDFTVSDPAARQMQIDEVKRQIDVCTVLEAEVLRLFAGWVSEKQVTDTSFAHVRECLSQLAPYAKANDVVLAVENHGGITATGAQCRRLLEDLPPSVGFTYDPANFRHCDEDPLAALVVIGNRVVYSHWKDVRLAEDEWEYCAMGEGVITWEPIVEELARFYDGYWAIEYEEPDDVERGTKVSYQYLRKCLDLA